MSDNIYKATKIPIEILTINEFTNTFNKQENITEKSNEEIESIQKQNKSKQVTFLKKIFALSLSKRKLFFKPNMSDWGAVSISIPFTDDEFKAFLEFGDNFKNYLFNNTYGLTDKMPECIEMGIEDVSMKEKLKFRESMPEYSYSEETCNDEKYHTFYNMITVKKSEQYGISPTIRINIQQICLLKDVFGNVFPTYLDGKPNMKKFINENNKYLVCDFEFFNSKNEVKITRKPYDFKKFLQIKILAKHISEDIEDEVKETKINELVKEITSFDENHYTFERYKTYMERQKQMNILGMEIAPTRLMCSQYRFDEMYNQNPMYSVDDFIENKSFYNKVEDYIVGKKEVDRDGKVNISKAKRSRYDFYLKLMVFDETPLSETKGTVRPNYYEIEPEPEATPVKEQASVVSTEEIETFDTTTDVPDSDED